MRQKFFTENAKKNTKSESPRRQARRIREARGGTVGSSVVQILGAAPEENALQEVFV
jgi:hypothetical protein